MSRLTDEIEKEKRQRNPIHREYDAMVENYEKQVFDSHFPARNRLIQMGINKIDQPNSLTAAVLSEITPEKVVEATKTGFSKYLDETKERRSNMSFGEKAKEELAVKPFKIASFLPRVIAGGITELGKTLEEFGITYGGAALPSISRDEASNFAVDTVTNSEKGKAQQEWLFGFEARSFADYKQPIQEFLDANPLATETEKKMYPVVLPFVMLATEMMPYGSAKKGFTELITGLVESTTEKQAKKWMIKAGFDKAFAGKVAKYGPGIQSRKQAHEILANLAEKEAQIHAKGFWKTVGSVGSKVSDKLFQGGSESSNLTRKNLDADQITTTDYLQNIMKDNPTAANLARDSYGETDPRISERLQTRFDNLSDDGKDAFIEISELLNKQASDLRAQTAKARQDAFREFNQEIFDKTLKEIPSLKQAIEIDPKVSEIVENFPRVADFFNGKKTFDYEGYQKLQPEEQSAVLDVLARTETGVAPDRSKLNTKYFNETDPKKMLTKEDIARINPDFISISKAFPKASKAVLAGTDDLSKFSAKEKEAYNKLLDIVNTQTVKNPKFTGNDIDVPIDPRKEQLGPAGSAIQSLYGPGVITTKNVSAVKKAEVDIYDEIDVALGNHLNQKFSDIPSWIPDHLADISTLKRFTSILGDGQTPNLVGSPEWELFDVFREKVMKEAKIEAEIVHNRAPDFFLQSHRERMWDPYSGTSFLPVQRYKRGTQVTIDIKKEREVSFEDLPNEPFTEKTTFKEFQNMRGPDIPDAEVKEVDDYFFQMDVPLKTLPDIKSRIRNTKDMFDVTREVFGEFYDGSVSPFFQRHHKNRSGRVTDRENYVKAMDDKIVKELGIKPNSKEAWAVVDLGEGRLTKGNIRKDFPKKAESIIEAEAWFRGQYKKMFDEWNGWSEKYYPGDTKRQLKWRTDYFHHGEINGGQLASGLRNLYEGVGLQGQKEGRMKDLPLPKGRTLGDTAIASYVPFLKKRKGDGNEYDALFGFYRYSEYFAYARNLDPEIYRINKFIDHLKENTDGNLDNYIRQMEDWVNDLSGARNPMDSIVGEDGPWGTFFSGALEWVDYFNQKAKINAILFNASSALSQVMNAPFLAMKAGPINTFMGVSRSMTDALYALDKNTVKRMNPDYEPYHANSKFIHEREELHSLYNKFNPSKLDDVKQVAGWGLGVFDNSTNKIFYNALYRKAVKRGHSNPHFWADETLRAMVGDRGAGGTALIHKSKIFQAAGGTFLVEVTQQFHRQFEIAFKKTRKEMSADELKMHDSRVKQAVTLYINVWAADSVLELIRGDGGYVNPIDAMYDSYRILSTDRYSAKEKAFKVTGRISGEMIGVIPMVGNKASSIIFEKAGWDAEDFFGESDPTRYGSSPLVFNAMNISEDEGGLMNLIYGVASPVGGGRQLEKFIGGIKASLTGETHSPKSDRPGMPVDTSGLGMVRNTFFGQWVPNFKYNADMEEKMRLKFYEHREAHLDDRSGEVKKDIDSMTDLEKKTYKEVAATERAEIIAGEIKAIKPIVKALDDISDNQLKAQELAKDTDDTKERNDYQRQAQAYYDAAQEIIEGLDDKEKKLLQEYRNREHEAGKEQRKEDRENPETWLKHAIDSTYALVTHPKQTTKIWLEGEMVEDTIGGRDGVVRPKRIDSDKITEIKKRLGKEQGVDYKDYHLGHIIPNGLGGTYAEDNYLLESPEENLAWTLVENYLVDAVKTDQIGREKAIDLILRYKQVDGNEPITFEEIQEIVGVEKFKDEEYQYLEGYEQNRGLDDIGRNMWPLSDTANTRRNDGHRRTLWDEITRTPTRKGTR